MKVLATKEQLSEIAKAIGLMGWLKTPCGCVDVFVPGSDVGDVCPFVKP